ncbi:hypothetical protein EON62_00745, partial [archaeon]
MPIGPSNNNATRASAIAVLCATAVLSAVWSAQVTLRSVVPSPGTYRIVQEIAPRAPTSADTAGHGATGTIDLPAVPTTAVPQRFRQWSRPWSGRPGDQ